MLTMFGKNNQILHYPLKFKDQICQIVSKLRMKFVIKLHLLVVSV